MTHAASEDTLTNLVESGPAEKAAAKKPAAAAATSATLPANIHARPTVKVAAKPAAKPAPKPAAKPSGPVKVEKLAEFVRSKKAKGSEGFKVDYGVSSCRPCERQRKQGRRCRKKNK